MIPHLVLRELDVPFEWVHVDRARDAHKAPDYLRLNPNGLIPVLTDSRGGEELVLYETAAICLHLADTHPAAGLLPPMGSAARAHAYKWLAWLSATLQPALIAWFYPERWVDAGNDEGARQVRVHAGARIGGLLDQLDAHLAASGRDWMLGERYSTSPDEARKAHALVIRQMYAAHSQSPRRAAMPLSSVCERWHAFLALARFRRGCASRQPRK
jgi:glutathione S-transferase